MQRILILLPLLCLFCSAASAQIYVDNTATGANNGTSWADAYNQLPPAFNDAPANAEIWIAAGNYFPSTGFDVTATLLRSTGIKVYGGFSGNETQLDQRDPAANVTFISGDLGNNDEVTVTTDPLSITYLNRIDNSQRIFTLSNASGDFVFDGLTIIGGQNTSTGAVVQISTEGDLSIDFTNCIFRDNFSRQGGTVTRLTVRTGDEMTINFTGSTFLNNSCSGGNGSKGGVMWAIANGPLAANYTNCNFQQNSSTGRAGTNNHELAVTANYVNCIFSGNRADVGGATFENSSEPAIYRNCTFYNNNSIRDFDSQGSVIFNFDDFGTDDVEIYNCIFSGNGQNPLRSRFSAEFQIANTLLEFDSFSDLNANSGGAVDLGNNLYNLDPLFVDTLGNDFSLDDDSPAINAGDNSLNDYPTDFTGENDRIANFVIDLGALENQTPSATRQLTEVTEVTIFPNPFVHSFQLSFENNQELALKGKQVNVFDAAGRQVYANVFPASDRIEVALNQLPTGSYWLELIVGNERFGARLIKK